MAPEDDGWEPPTPTTDPALKRETAPPKPLPPPPRLPPLPPELQPRRKPMTLGWSKARGVWKSLALIGAIAAVGAGAATYLNRLASKDDVRTIVESETKALDKIPAMERKQAVQDEKLNLMGKHSQWQTDRILDLSKDRGFAGSRARPRQIPPPPPRIEPPDAGVGATP